MTGKRFTSEYNNQSDMIQYVDTQKEEPNRWSVCNVSETLKKLNALHEENQELRLQLNQCSDQRNEFHRGARENAHRVGKLKEENEQLKQRINSRLHFYRELYETTNDDVVKRVIEDLEDVLR